VGGVFFSAAGLGGLGGVKIAVLNGYTTIPSTTIYIENRYPSNPRMALLGPAYYSLNAALVADINIVIILAIYSLYIE